MVTRKMMLDYVNAGLDLIEAIKTNIKKDNKIDNKTVLALNKFVTAYNEIQDLSKQLADQEDNSSAGKTRH